MENFISCIRKNMENEVISNYPRKDADYLERLKSFEQIDDLPISKEKAAIAGFEYIGPQDRLRCVYCDGQLESWAATDDPLRAHIDTFPTCPFLIPLLTHPTNRSMSSYDERLASFSSWGRRCPSAEDLAAAGFYKSRKRGFPDSVKCFFCGLPLHSWEAGDLPWEEHARWQPHCGFLILVKGYGFITYARKKLEMIQIAESEDINENENEELICVDNVEKLEREELERVCLSLAAEMACKVCLTKKINTVFVPCRHQCCCSDCAKRLELCPICRTRLKSAIRVFS